ncbi:hypothetical protein MMC16_003928 [Acarospora aff. strigata]|nr:hypothetical protein [Acarospora aff. strigata]
MVFAAFRPAKAETVHRAQTRRSLFRSSSSASLKPLPLTPSATGIIPVGFPSAAREHVLSEEDPSLHELNNSLDALAAIFPDVRPEVFREMLQSFGEESRLHVVAEQLLRHKAEWVKGRWRVPSKDTTGATLSGEPGSAVKGVGSITGSASRGDGLVPTEEHFRSESYKRAARAMLCQEFRGLSRSAVDAVLAEHNYSYTLARPTLVDIAAESWRVSFSAFFLRRKRSTEMGLEKHPMVLWERAVAGDAVPVLKETGSKELDAELYETLLAPLLRRRHGDQEATDRDVALQLNEDQAEQAEALYECECCFSSTTFEQMATCDLGSHIICFRCLRHAVSEALFGQGWGRNVEHGRGQIKCLAPMADIGCEGCIPQSLTKRAVEEDKAGIETWRKLEERITEEALLKSQVKLVRCPFCAYAEIDDIYLPPTHRVWRLRRRSIAPLLLTLILFFEAILYLVLLTLLYTLFTLFPNSPFTPLPTLLTHHISTSLTTLIRARRSPKFTCRNPLCLRASCLLCAKPWLDIHTCLEPPHALSLRTTVEAARTAALKRTCPRCALSFIKASGCNKLTCVCGYQMCYVCRRGLNHHTMTTTQSGGRAGNAGRRGNGAGDGDGDGGAEGEGEGEGYRHFCQHFRVNGGRCSQCDKCDLYKAEDEDVLVKRAGERAEREWRIREGMVGVRVGVGVRDGRGAKGLMVGTRGYGKVKDKGTGIGTGVGEEEERWWEQVLMPGVWIWSGWEVQDIVDTLVGAVVEVR